MRTVYHQFTCCQQQRMGSYTISNCSCIAQKLKTRALCLHALQVDTQDNSLVQSAISCTVDGQNLLVLGNEGGLQVRLQIVLLFLSAKA
jgi:hypothetical protein